MRGLELWTTALCWQHGQTQLLAAGLSLCVHCRQPAVRPAGNSQEQPEKTQPSPFSSREPVWKGVEVRPGNTHLKPRPRQKALQFSELMAPVLPKEGPHVLKTQTPTPSTALSTPLGFHFFSAGSPSRQNKFRISFLPSGLDLSAGCVGWCMEMHPSGRHEVKSTSASANN